MCNKTISLRRISSTVYVLAPPEAVIWAAEAEGGAVLKGGAGPSDHGTGKGHHPPPGSAWLRHVSASGGSGGAACTSTAAAPAGKQPSMSTHLSLCL